MSLKQQLLDRVVTPITQENETFVTVAIVVTADDKNNCCDVQYIDKHGKLRTRENVIVRLAGSGMEWFPSPGDYVNIEIGREICVIVARAVTNYNMDVRSKMELKQDIHSDSFGYQPGASIY